MSATLDNRRDHHRGVPQSVPLHLIIQEWAVKRSGVEKFVVDMCKEAHAFIERRQHEVAEELMDWRDAQVTGWENVLKEAERGGMSDGVTPPSGGAATQNRGVPRQEGRSEEGASTPNDRGTTSRDVQMFGFFNAQYRQ
jgi:hypothetical protein